jgi:nucleoid-associated protein YgaU
MAVVGVTRPRTADERPDVAGGHPKAILEAERGTRLVLPYAPQGSTLAGLADTWDTVARPGRKALVLHTGKRVPTMSLTLTLARKDRQTSIEGILDKLYKLGEAEERVTLSNMSPRERGPWRITDLAIEATARQHGTNLITRATATLTLTAASDALSRRGPLSGGKDSGPGAGKVRRYTVKKGDTLRKLADRFLGSPDRWKAIAKLNGIKRPGADLKPGRVLKIPVPQRTAVALGEGTLANYDAGLSAVAQGEG